MGPTTLAILPFVRGESCGCRSLAQDIATGARQQSQNQKSDERFVFSRNPVGVDRTDPIKSVRQSAKPWGHRMFWHPKGSWLYSRNYQNLFEQRQNSMPSPARDAANWLGSSGRTWTSRISLFTFVVPLWWWFKALPKPKLPQKMFDAALAESLLKLRLTSPYNRETDWVFASPTMKGKQPLWPDTLWRRYGPPAVKAAEIKKRVAFYTFRHMYTTLLTQNSEDIKVVQELLRHAYSRVTLDLYAQAGMQEKREAQSKLVRLVLNNGEALA
jgi:Phage integrase family